MIIVHLYFHFLGIFSSVFFFFFFFWHTALLNIYNFQIYLTNRSDTNRFLPFRVRVVLEELAMKEASILPRSPEVEPHHQIKFSVIPWKPRFLSVLSLCRGCSEHVVTPADEVSALFAGFQTGVNLRNKPFIN